MTRETGDSGGDDAGPAERAMNRYADGDDSAFPELYDVVAPRLAAYVRRNVRDAHLADDIIQQTFLHMHRARSSFVRGAAVLPWAFAIARRLIIDVARLRVRAGREVPVDESSAVSPRPDCEQAVQAAELARRVADQLARLPDSQRQAFHLVQEEGLPLKEAARILGTTVAAVRLRARRAITSLRSALERDFRR